MLISDLQTNVKNKLGLSSTEAALALTWLTAGYRDLLLKTMFFISTESIDIEADVQDYTLPTDMDLIQDVTILGSLVKPDRVTREEILDLRRYANSGTTQGDVYCYCIYGQMLNIYPMPSADSTMLVYYLAEPNDGSDFDGTEDLVTDLNMVPLGPLSKALEYYGLYQGSEYDDKSITENATTYLQLYDKYTLEAKKAVRKRSGRTNTVARVGYPVKRGFPHRRDVYPAISRTEV